MALNPLKSDPTRTVTLRKRMIADLTRRIRKLKREIVKLVAEEDAFGLNPRDPFTINTRWQFRTNAEKVQEFRRWFQERVDEGILWVDSETQEPWTSTYVHSAYQQGVNRAFQDVRPAGFTNDQFYAGGKQQFLQDAFSGPDEVAKLKLLYTRTFEELKGFTTQMATDLNRSLTDSLVKGLGARDTARNIVDEVDGIERKRAKTIARTELVHAHAEGQLDAFERLGIEEVGAMVEWSTAGDSRVCPTCQSLEGKRYTVEEAHGKLPIHPNCRCAWIPYISRRSGK